MKENEDDTNRWKDILCSRSRRLNIVKMAIMPKATCRSNPYPNTNGILHRTRTNNFKICMGTQKTLNSQNNLEKKEQSWRYYTLWFQTTLQSYSNQNSMGLAQKQKYRSMEEDRRTRHKPTHIWSSYLW